MKTNDDTEIGRGITFGMVRDELSVERFRYERTVDPKRDVIILSEPQDTTTGRLRIDGGFATEFNPPLSGEEVRVRYALNKNLDPETLRVVALSTAFPCGSYAVFVRN